MRSNSNSTGDKLNSLVRKWGEQVIRSRQYASGLALFVAFLSFFDLPIGWLSTVIIALVTLQEGAKKGLSVMAWAILPAMAMLYLKQYAIFLNIVVMHYLIVFTLAVVLRKYNSWVNVFQVAAGMGIVFVVLVHYFIPDLQAWLINQLTALANEYKKVSLFNFGKNEIDKGIQYLGMVGTGLISLAVIMANLMTLFLARWWQSNIVPTINLQKECYSIRIHYSLALALIALGFGLYVNESLFINILALALMPFILSGMSLLHAFFATRKNGGLVLTFFYTLVLFLSPYMMVFTAFMGWVDSFINFRKKFVLGEAIKE